MIKQTCVLVKMLLLIDCVENLCYEEICLATIGVGVFRCGNFGCRTFCLDVIFGCMGDSFMNKFLNEYQQKIIRAKNIGALLVVLAFVFGIVAWFFAEDTDYWNIALICGFCCFVSVILGVILLSSRNRLERI